MFRLSVLGTIACLLGNEAAALPPTEQRVEVRVRSSWDGLGPSVMPGGFDVVCRVSECPLGVRLLLRCLGAAPKEHFQTDDLADVVSWLQTATPQDIHSFNGGVYDALYSHYSLPRVRREFEATRTDPDFLRSLLSHYYSPTNRWTDDYPDVLATVVLPDGETVTLSSRAQQYFMIPWSVARSGRQYSTYEPNIGRALACLGPQQFVGRERLSGKGLRAWLLGELFNRAFQKVGPKP
jgi:hypothetical protein